MLAVGIPFAAAAPPASLTMCIYVRYQQITLSSHFAMRKYAPLYPLTTWKAKALTVGAGTPRDIVRAYLENGTDCDFVGYMSSSPAAFALLPLIPTTTAWMDSLTASTDLTPTDVNKAFNRVIPTGDVAAQSAAVALHALGFKLISVLCADNAYGRSAAAGMAKKFAELGGSVERSRCFPETANASTVMDALLTVTNGTSRVLFLAGATTAYGPIRELNLTKDIIVVLPESGCMAATVVNLPGALCATYAMVPSRAAVAAAEYRARNISLDRAVFGNSMTAGQYASSTFDMFCGFAIDAMRLTMDAMYNFNDRPNPTQYPNMATFIRSRKVLDGLTGEVSLDSNGDRVSATLAFFNAQPKASNSSQYELVQLGLISGNDVVFDDAKTAYWAILGGYYNKTAPSDLKPVPAPPVLVAPAVEFPYWVLAIVGACAVLCAVVVARWAAGRIALARCPKDDSLAYSVMFVGVKNEDVIRDRHPEDASKLFSHLAAKIKDLVRKHGCHEARRINETTWMVVAKQAKDAVACASAIQLFVAEENWRPLMHPAQAVIRTSNPGTIRNETQSVRSSVRRKNANSTAGDDTRSTRKSNTSDKSTTKKSASSSGVCYFPPTAFIGIHTGMGSIDHNEETGTFSYHGQAVDRAAMVADTAVAGQIAISAHAVEAATGDESGRTGLAGGAFAFYRAINVPVPQQGFAQKAATVCIDLMSFTPENYSEATRVQARIDKVMADSDKDDNVGGIACALSQAESGFARRRVGVVVVFIPGLLNPGNRFTDVEHSRRVQQILADVVEITTHNKGTVSRVTDGRVTIYVNSTGPVVSQPETRAATIGHQLSELKQLDAIFRETTIGIAFGKSMEGASSGVAASLGNVATFARMTQRAAAFLKEGCLCIDTCYDDLFSRFQTETVDAVAMPTSDEQQAGPCKVTRLIALIRQRDETAEGEWLYQMQPGAGGGGTPSDNLLAIMDQRWAALASGAKAGDLPGLPVMPTGLDPDNRIAVIADRLADAQAAESFAAYAARRSADMSLIH